MSPELVFCVAFTSDGFILVENHERGGWEFPGGAVEPGEDPETAVLREFTEETGRELTIMASERDASTGAWIFYGKAGSELSGITDPAISRAAAFREPPEPLASRDRLRRDLGKPVHRPRPSQRAPDPGRGRP